jgi:hypothetical protein
VKFVKSPGQYVLLHICMGCRTLVPYPRALAMVPDSPGANCNFHKKCAEASRRWIWPRFDVDEHGNDIVRPIEQTATHDGLDDIHPPTQEQAIQ